MAVTEQAKNALELAEKDDNRFGVEIGLELGHWIASPMRNVGTSEQFHEVVDRAAEIINLLRSRTQGAKVK